GADIAFGMRHQPQHVPLRIADARDITNGAVGIAGIGDYLPAISRARPHRRARRPHPRARTSRRPYYGICIYKWYLSIGLQLGEYSGIREDKLAFAMSYGQFE